MRIIIEGADLTGKSTLVPLLADRLDIPYRGRITKAKKDQWEVNERDLNEHENHVLDRCYWLTDLIYERAVNKSSIFDHPGYIVKQMYSSVYIICVCTDKDEHMHRYEQRPDDLWTFEDIRKYQAEYLLFAERMYQCPNPMVLDTWNKSVEVCLNEIQAFLVGLVAKHQLGGIYGRN